MSSLEDSIKVWRTANAAILHTDNEGKYWFNHIPSDKFDEFKQILVYSLEILSESCPNIMENEELLKYFAQLEIYLSKDKKNKIEVSQ